MTIVRPSAQILFMITVVFFFKNAQPAAASEHADACATLNACADLDLVARARTVTELYLAQSPFIHRSRGARIEVSRPTAEPDIDMVSREKSAIPAAT
jgi:hypothetical protein